MKTYLEYVDEKSSKFWELTLDGSSFTVRYGKIGTDGRENVKDFDSEDEAREAAEKLIKSKTRKGYVPVSAGGNPEPTQITFEDAVARYPTIGEGNARPLAKMAGIATVYEGDVVTDSFSITNLAVERGEKGTIIVVDGDLTLTHDSVTWDRNKDFENNVLLVTGNMKANGLKLVDIGAVMVLGDLDVKVLMGAYGDNGGSIDVGGHTTADLVMATTYFMFGFEGGVTADTIIGDSTYATDWTDDFINKWDFELFVDEVLMNEEEVEEFKVYDRFLAGEPIFKT